MDETTRTIICLAIVISPIVLGLGISLLLDIIEKYEFEKFLHGEDEG